MISRFFVDRPIFANVIAVITVLFGVVALYRLPVERYPAVTPPTVQVSTNYPGANAKVVADTVAAPIEQQINGVENMMYMSSTSSSDGSYGLSRVNGVGEVTVRGVGSYAMRIWVDPDKLAARQLTTQDVTAALARQNVQVAAGQVGQPPNPPGQQFQFTVTTLGRLSDPKQFEEIILKSGTASQVVYLRDVARVELGAQTYDSFSNRSGFESANILIYQLPGSNAID